MDQLTPVAPLISAEESARRKAAIDYARGSVRLEGFVYGERFSETTFTSDHY